MGVAVLVGVAVAGAAATAAVSLANTASVNRTNRQIAEDTNATNAANTAATNQANKELMEQQNVWNREQWNLENAYNSPEAQKQRYIEAGLNPVWAMGSSPSAGTAYDLTSASPSPMVAPVANPYRVNPVDPGVIKQIGDSLFNSVTGLSTLGISKRAQTLKELLGKSESERNYAEAGLKRAQTEGQRVENEWNVESFSVRLEEEAQKLRNMEGQLNKMDADTDAARALKLNYEEERKLISERITQVKESVAQRWKDLQIQAQNANTNFKMYEAKMSELTLQGKQFEAQVAKWNNDTLMQYMYKFGKIESQKNKASMDAQVKLGTPGSGFGFGADYSGEESSSQVIPATQQSMLETGLKVISVGSEVIDRAQKYPTPQHLLNAAKAAEYIEASLEVIRNSFDSYSPAPESNGIDTDFNLINPYPFDSWLR